ncbi:unnamed protein product [Bathycoccus prasinos]|mmetsp:Transcript_3758/g.12527  ORF Transcript_3758/g.12527 Transcript_3758/m.12527 type:complete len:287 (-) Transcript_3758:182-1042(-)
MTNLIKKKERNDGFAESNASPPCVGHAFMNAKPDPYESFESCSDCGDSLNLGQRIVNSKRVEGSKLCGRCYQKEHKAWVNGEFDAYDGKKYEGKQPRTESERREREREKFKHKKETNKVISSGVLKRDVPFNVYDKEMRKHYKENEHVVKSNTLGGHVPFGKYRNELEKHYKENALREMQANVSMNRSRCVNSECNRRLSPTWSSFSNMESEVIHLWKLAGITKTEEQVRDVLEHMLGADVSAAMKNSEGVYLCLTCKEKKFYQVRQAAYAEFLRRRRVERRDEDE